MIDIIWKLIYPTEILLTFLPFFIFLKKKSYYFLKFILSFLIIYLLSYLRIYFLGNNIKLIEVFYYILVFVLLYFAVLWIFDYTTIVNSMFITAYIIAMQHLSYKLAVAFSLFIDINILSTATYFPLIFTCIALIDAACYFLIIRHIPSEIRAENQATNIVGVTLLLITAIIVNLFIYDIFFMDFPNHTLICSLINFLEIIVTILIVLFLYYSAISSQAKEENAILKIMASKNRERYELAKITIDEINIKYHDLKHALTNENLDEEEKKEIQETLTNYKAIIHTSNRGLDIIVYESQLKCISKEIDLNVLIDGDPIAFIKPHHIYSLLSNLLDNAIEAVENLDKSKKRIILKINKVGDSAIIILTNYVDSPVKLVGGWPLTTKNDKRLHGFGTRSIKLIVDRYNGNISFENSEGTFKTKIIIPIQ